MNATVDIHGLNEYFLHEQGLPFSQKES